LRSSPELANPIFAKLGRDASRHADVFFAGSHWDECPSQKTGVGTIKLPKWTF
jgi:hypothetical protein